MKIPSPQPSPALAQGLRLLQEPALREGETLEALSRGLGLPKSSVLRHLRTLEDLGCVRRLPDLRWQAQMRLVSASPLEDAGETMRRILMERVREETGWTVEWYRGTSEGMELRDQRLAEGEIRVVARPGYVRRWGEELDAVARLGYAFDPAAGQPEASFWGYRRNGQRTEWSAAQVHKQISEAAGKGWAADTAFNSNAVRRSALLVRHAGQYLGVLAVAEAFSFSETPPVSTTVKTLQSLLQHAYSLH